jgi:hypothetical protein
VPKTFSFKEEFSKILSYIYIIGLHAKCPLLLSDFNFNYNGIFSTGFRKALVCQISLNPRGRTEVTKLIVAYHTVAKERAR